MDILDKIRAIVLDTETGGTKKDSGALIHDLATVEFDVNTWEPIPGGARLYKVATPYEQSTSPLVRAGLEGKVASYEPFDSPRIFQGLRRANESYNEFAGKVLQQVFQPTPSGKTILVKNLNFEASFFQDILNDPINSNIRDEIFGNLAGYDKYDLTKGTGRIGITSFKVRQAVTRANLASSEILTKGMSGDRLAATINEFATAAEETINAIFNPVANKTQFLDIDHISRGIIALGQKHGLLAKSADFYTGVNAETLALLLKQSGVAHFALDDALQEGNTSGQLIGLYRSLQSGNEAVIKDKSLQKVFRTWDKARLKAGKQFTSIENYLHAQHQILTHGWTDDLTTGNYINRGKGTFVENGIEMPYDVWTAQRMKIYKPSDVTAHYRKRGLTKDIFSDAQARELEGQISALKGASSAAKEELANKILAIKATTRDARLAALEAIGKGTGKYRSAADVMAEVVGKIRTGPGSIKTGVPWMKIGGLALAGALFMGIMNHNSQQNQDKKNNVVFQQDLDRINAASEYSKRMSGSPSKLGYRKDDLAADFYAQGMGDEGKGGETLSESRGTKIHAQLEAEYKRAGLASETEIEFRDRIHGMHGYVDWLTPDNRVADIKTVNEERFKDVATVGRPFHKGEAQLRYYMEEMNTKSGFLRYVNQDNPDESVDVPVEYDPDKVRADLYKMDQARKEAAHAMEIDKRKIEKLKKKEELRRISLDATKQKEAQQHYRY